MANTVSFSITTTTVNSGKTIRVINTSAFWDEFVASDYTGATLVITTTNGLDTFLIAGEPSHSFTKSIDITVIESPTFYFDILSSELYGSDIVIPDDILTFTLTILSDTSHSLDVVYVTDEVFYYNSFMLKSDACYNAIVDSCNINSTEVKYACLVNALYQGLQADIFVANTSGIYDKFNIFKRL